MDDSNALVIKENYELMEKVLLEGDLSKLTSQERVQYYDVTCKSLGLNPTTRPFDYIKLNGKLTLYARKDATEQLRKNNGVSIVGLDKEWKDNLGLYIVTAKAQDRSGRTDAATGAVFVKGMTGDNLSNAIMKAETKAKRRVTLSICGLGFSDESEIQGIPEAKPVIVTSSGDIIDGKATVVSTEPETKGDPQKQQETTLSQESASSDSEKVVWFDKTNKPADGLLDIKNINGVMEKFVGKDKTLESVAHLKNHLRKYYHVDTLQEMTWVKGKALIEHLKGVKDDPKWYPPEPVKVDDPESSSGFSDEYLNKVVSLWSAEDKRLNGVKTYGELPDEKKVEMMTFLTESVGKDKTIESLDDVASIAGYLAA